MDMKSDRYGYLRKSGAIGVCAKAISVSGSTRGKGSLGSASEEKKGLAKRANIEGNESAHYEKLEKRSLRSLKGGGTEKELRDGHNTRGGLGAAMKHGGGYKTPKKAQPAYNPETNPIRAQKQASKMNVAAAKASGVQGAVKRARSMNKVDMKAARDARQARNKLGLRKSDRAAGKMARKNARMGLGALV